LQNVIINGQRRVTKNTVYSALSADLKSKMQIANTSYINGDNAGAKEALRTVIRERPDAHDAWLTLGMIYQSEGLSSNLFKR
jgi:Tfp pilus assembly protein PilF